MTKTQTTMMAGSLPNPDSASDGLSTPVRARARTARIATRSFRSHSVKSSPNVRTRITKKVIWCKFRFASKVPNSLDNNTTLD
jgi:hypothetical protein